MTNANTPTTREREAARELAKEVWERIFSTGNQGEFLSVVSDRIAAVLARTRREALTEAAAIAANNKDSVFPQDSIETEIELLRDSK